MVEINGKQFPGKTPEENTADMIDYINQYCRDNDIRNSKGEVIYIDAIETNPLYMMIYGQGYLLSMLQKLVQSAGNGFSIASSSERQLSNIAEIARVKKMKASRTSIVCLIYAEDEKDCVITYELTAEVPYGSSKAVFHPAYETTIPAGGVQPILLLSDTPASYNIAAGTITAFKENPAGLRRMETYDAIPGVREETTAEMRARMQGRTSTSTLADRCAESIQQLDGVSRCNIYVNTSSVDVLTVNGIDIPPRQVLLMVQGYNDDIAKVFYSYMMMKTTPASEERTILQYYTTNAHQKLPVYIIEPSTTPLYVRAYLEYSIADEQIASLKDLICSNSMNSLIGGSVDAGQLIKLIGAAYPVQGLELSKDLVHWSYKATPQPDQLFIYNVANVQIIVDEGDEGGDNNDQDEGGDDATDDEGNSEGGDDNGDDEEDPTPTPPVGPQPEPETNYAQELTDFLEQLKEPPEEESYGGDNIRNELRMPIYERRSELATELIEYPDVTEETYTFMTQKVHIMLTSTISGEAWVKQWSLDQQQACRDIEEKLKEESEIRKLVRYLGNAFGFYAENEDWGE